MPVVNISSGEGVIAAPLADPFFNNVVFLARTADDESPSQFIDLVGGHGAGTFGSDADMRIDGESSHFDLSMAAYFDDPSGFDPSGAYTEWADSNDFNLPETVDWTIEGWFKHHTLDVSQVYFSQYNSSGSQRGYYLVWDAGQSPTDIVFRNWLNGGVTQNVNLKASFEPLLNEWFHAAVCYTASDNTYYLGVDGDILATVVDSSAVHNSTEEFRIGKFRSSPNDAPFSGYCSELRITKGTARYTGASYNVPTSKFPSSL